MHQYLFADIVVHRVSRLVCKVAYERTFTPCMDAAAQMHLPDIS